MLSFLNLFVGIQNCFVSVCHVFCLIASESGTFNTRECEADVKYTHKLVRLSGYKYRGKKPSMMPIGNICFAASLRLGSTYIFDVLFEKVLQVIWCKQTFYCNYSI